MMNQQMNNTVYDSASKSQMGYDSDYANLRQRQSGYAMPILFALVALSYAVNIPSLVVGVMAYVESHKTPKTVQSQPIIVTPCYLEPPQSFLTAMSSTWSYSGLTGPSYWMNLSPLYTTCGTGKKQSPINIDSSLTQAAAATDPDLRLSYFQNQDVGKLVQNDFSNKVTLTNDGYGIKITTLGLFMNYGSLWYQLVNLRFHTPSEHTSTAQRSLILSVLVEEGGLASPAYLADVLAKIPTSSVGQVLQVSLDMTQMLTGILFPNGGNTTTAVPYYTYSGSLTAPPCSEDVQTRKMFQVW
ncbi:hypothetical protein GUITHDRAFT_142746 [Guillardia theta CCMP2712]|uniref:carbonic anhydrase n=1 Tax=Guillardia theta (strain CCMP2712) TaxID=905079 RepID=L1IX21_GUITC|nr:hypothetical protein GUITHDRAFT_142746 [Guillardia theta CCMP2712]EKX40429.1 hypothetical protein GUITHDRAFT_142746 [Guillardia theta CCMP2712]|eukprot:XP_005827409.1 hypothetical protein GUITHDRAFT_142746 [Guillardia theta CCMP2712]